jgi:hypothetical protein
MATGANFLALLKDDLTAYVPKQGDKLVVDGFVCNADSAAGNSYDLVLFCDESGGGAYVVGTEFWAGAVFAQYGQPAGLNPFHATTTASDGANKGRLGVNVTAIGAAGTPTDLGVTVYGRIIPM